MSGKQPGLPVEKRRATPALPADCLEEAQHIPRFLLACEVANWDPEVALIEREFDSLPGEPMEPWTDAPEWAKS